MNKMEINYVNYEPGAFAREGLSYKYISKKITKIFNLSKISGKYDISEVKKHFEKLK